LNARFLAQYNNETVAADGTSLYSYSAAQSSWVNKGPCPSIGVTRQTTAINSTIGVIFSDSAVNGSLEMTVFVTGDIGLTLYYTVRDLNTGSIVVATTAIGYSNALRYARVVSVGSNFAVFFAQSATNPVVCVLIPASTLVVGAPITVSANAVLMYDVAAYSNVAYVVTYVTGTVQLYSVTSTGTVTSIGTQAATVTCLGLFVDRVGGWRIVTWADSTHNLYTWSPSYWVATLLFSPLVNTITSITGYSSSGIGAILVSSSNGTPLKDTLYTYSFNSGTYVTSNGLPMGAHAVTVPIAVGSANMVLVAHQTRYHTGISSGTYLGVYLWVDINTGNVWARVAQEDGAYQYETQTVCVVPRAVRSTYRFPILVVNRLYALAQLLARGEPIILAGADTLTLDLANTNGGYQTAQLGGDLFVSGGMLMQYDGSQTAEHGFNYPPVLVSATAVSSGLGNLGVGTYSWAIVWEWEDAQGNVHQSAPVFSSPVTLTATQECDLVFSTLQYSYKASRSVIRIYRTLVNGSVYYQFPSPVTNNPAMSTVGFNDVYADTAISSGALLYTQQQVPASPGPPCSALVAYRNRLMLAATEAPDQLWYSLTNVPGQPVQMSDLFELNIDPTGGGISALGVMDDKLMIAKPSVWFYMTGDGPDQLGNNSTFSTPLMIDAASGCSVPDSVVTTAQGIMYQSSKGIWLISRGLQEQYIGEGVESSALGSTVVGAAIVPNTTQVRFALANGTVLVWDYFAEQWSTFPYPWFTLTAAGIVGNVWSMMNSLGQLYSETPGVFYDYDPGTGNLAISLSLTTAWLKFAGLQGFQRVLKMLVLGSYYSAHTLKIQVAYDFVGTVAQTDTISVLSDPGPYQFRIFLAKQKCESVQITITQGVALDGAGQHGDLSGLAFEVGLKPGVYRLPAANSYG
jgi:hypothetical protein